MPLWFVRGLRRGVVTTRYPARPDDSAAWLPTPPTFRSRRLTCQAADRMVAVCPSLALSRRDDVLVFEVGACTACGRCAEAAPDVVAPSGEFELAATVRSAQKKKSRSGEASDEPQPGRDRGRPAAARHDRRAAT